MMTTDLDPRAEFLAGARQKHDALRALSDGQDTMEHAAWRLVEEGGVPKAQVPGILRGILTDAGLDPSCLGVSAATVGQKWLHPRNRDRVLGRTP